MAHFDQYDGNRSVSFPNKTELDLRNETVVINSDNRISYQNIKLLNEDNEYAGCLSGQAFLLNSYISSSFLEKCELVDSTLCGFTMFNEEGEQLDFEGDIENLSSYIGAVHEELDNAELAIASLEKSHMELEDVVSSLAMSSATSSRIYGDFVQYVSSDNILSDYYKIGLKPCQDQIVLNRATARMFNFLCGIKR